MHWPGDAQATWNGLAGNLRGALAMSWSGFQYWSTDIGGFFRRDEWRSGVPEDDSTLLRPDPEVFIRWVQFGMLVSHSRFHGMVGREPWLFGDEAVAVTKRFIELRQSLLPYLLRCAAEAAETGVPLLRPVALEFPDDPGARHIDSEYLLGPDLLVAPVLEPGGRVDVYVPEGALDRPLHGRAIRGPPLGAARRRAARPPPAARPRGRGSVRGLSRQLGTSTTFRCSAGAASSPSNALTTSRQRHDVCDDPGSVDGAAVDQRDRVGEVSVERV